MALLPIDEGMAKWSKVSGLILAGNEKLAMIQFNGIAKAIKDGKYKLAGDPVSVIDFSVFMEWIRPRVEWPLPPSFIETPEHMTKVLTMPKPPPKSFVWKWMELSIPWVAEDSSEHLVFPLPVAVVAKEIHSYKCLVSATAMWHLLPVDEPVGRFFAVDIRTTERWQVWHDQLGVCEGELLAPAKSIAAKKRARPPAARASPAVGVIVPFVAEAASSDEDSDGNPLSFAQYMMTSKVMLGALMWLAHVKKVALSKQIAIFEIAKNIASWVPAGTSLPGVVNFGQMVDVMAIKKRVRETTSKICGERIARRWHWLSLCSWASTSVGSGGFGST